MVFVQFISKNSAKTMKIKFYLDTRAVKKGDPAPLKLSFTHNSKSALLSLGIFLTEKQFNSKTERVENHKNKTFYNSFIVQKRLEAENIILELNKARKLSQMTATELKNYISKKFKNDDPNENTIKSVFIRFIDSKTNESTKKLYTLTFHHLQDFCINFDTLRFEDVNSQFLTDFDNHLLKTSPKKNARNIHLRNLRAVFNYAIDNEITSAYPFRRFKIHPVPTAKRSLTISQLRNFISMPLLPFQEQYRDIFMLIFYLIGINTIDLLNLKGITSDGRVEYLRAKTGKRYSIKVEPEALEIINKYRGKLYLINILDRYGNYQDYRKRLNLNLKRFGETDFLSHGKKEIHPEFPMLTSYWARHTWATIASYLDIPKETIARALGHGCNTVTDIYIDFDQNKIDEANRKVINFVLYNKR